MEKFEFKFKEVAAFYAKYHRKLVSALGGDLKRRAADFYFLEGKSGLKARITPPPDSGLPGFWNEEAKRLMNSKTKRWRDEQQAWSAAKAATEAVVEEVGYRFQLWQSHCSRNLPEHTCLALQKITLGKLKKLVKSGVKTTVDVFNRSSQLEKIKGIGPKTAAELRQRVRPRKSDLQPTLDL